MEGSLVICLLFVQVQVMAVQPQAVIVGAVIDARRDQIAVAAAEFSVFCLISFGIRELG